MTNPTLSNDQCPHYPCFSSSSPHQSMTFHTSGSWRSLRNDEEGLCQGDHATLWNLLRAGLTLSCILYNSSFLRDKKIRPHPCGHASDKGNKDYPMNEWNWPTERTQNDITDPWSLYRVVKWPMIGQSLGRDIFESTWSTRASKVPAGPNRHLARVGRHATRRWW